jgi:Holliday junction DNA helicase RuvB
VQSDSVLHAEGVAVDDGLDVALRPRDFSEFVGQSALVANLRVYLTAAQGRGEPIEHLLLSGLPGLGKTSLAHIIARELGVACRGTSGPALVRPADLAGILTNLGRGDLLFVDEIHRLPPAVEEYLYSAMEDFEIDILIDQGPSARSVKVPLQRFTLIGATTREGQLSAPFRSRFGLMEKLQLYAAEELAEIARRSAARLGTPIEPEAAEVIAHRARGTPRIANRLVKRVRDFAQVAGEQTLRGETARGALARLGIDENGLGETDRRLLVALHRAGRPVGLKGLAVAVGEDDETVEDVYEPFLLTEGWILRTPRGRCLTERGLQWAESESPHTARETPPPRTPQGRLF